MFLLVLKVNVLSLHAHHRSDMSGLGYDEFAKLNCIWVFFTCSKTLVIGLCAACLLFRCLRCYAVTLKPWEVFIIHTPRKMTGGLSLIHEISEVNPRFSSKRCFILLILWKPVSKKNIQPEENPLSLTVEPSILDPKHVDQCFGST